MMWHYKKELFLWYTMCLWCSITRKMFLQDTICLGCGITRESCFYDIQCAYDVSLWERVFSFTIFWSGIARKSRFYNIHVSSVAVQERVFFFLQYFDVILQERVVFTVYNVSVIWHYGKVFSFTIFWCGTTRKSCFYNVQCVCDVALQERAAKNNTFLYIKIPEVQARVSYKVSHIFTNNSQTLSEWRCKYTGCREVR